MSNARFFAINVHIPCIYITVPARVRKQAGSAPYCQFNLLFLTNIPVPARVRSRQALHLQKSHRVAKYL